MALRGPLPSGVVRVSGPDRLSWLHSLTSQHLVSLAPNVPTAALVLSPQGHVEQAMYGVDDGEAFTAHVEPARLTRWWSGWTGCAS
jgi:folate-binding Fe-S cluster repair protein YgfZ